MTRHRNINTREFWVLIRPLLSAAAIAQAECDHRMRTQCWDHYRHYRMTLKRVVEVLEQAHF